MPILRECFTSISVLSIILLLLEEKKYKEYYFCAEKVLNKQPVKKPFVR